MSWNARNHKLALAIVVPVVVAASLAVGARILRVYGNYLPQPLAEIVRESTTTPNLVIAERALRMRTFLKSHPFLIHADLVDEEHQLLVQNNGSIVAESISITIQSSDPIISASGFGDVDVRNENGAMLPLGARKTYLVKNSFEVFFRANSLDPRQMIRVSFVIRRPASAPFGWPNVLVSCNGNVASHGQAEGPEWISRTNWN